MPLIASTGLPSLFSNFTELVNSRSGWIGLGTCSNFWPWMVHSRSTPRVILMWLAGRCVQSEVKTGINWAREEEDVNQLLVWRICNKLWTDNEWLWMTCYQCRWPGRCVSESEYSWSMDHWVANKRTLTVCVLHLLIEMINDVLSASFARPGGGMGLKSEIQNREPVGVAGRQNRERNLICDARQLMSESLTN